MRTNQNKKLTRLRIVRLSCAAVAAVLLVCSVAFAVKDASVGETVLKQGDIWEHRLDSGEYAYRIDYLDGDMFVTVSAQFLGPQGGILMETSHTLVRDQRMSVQQNFRTDAVSDSAAPERIRFACDSGRVRVALHTDPLP